MLQALGARLLDADGRELPPGGAALARLARLDLSGLEPRLAGRRIDVACDVDNPLTGPRGASAVFGPQKGATPAMVAELDAALAHFAARLEHEAGVAVTEVAGPGPPAAWAPRCWPAWAGSYAPAAPSSPRRWAWTRRWPTPIWR